MELIIVPRGYADPVMFAGCTPYGARAISQNMALAPSDANLEAARFQGRRVTFVAGALKTAGIAATMQGQSDRVRA